MTTLEGIILQGLISEGGAARSLFQLSSRLGIAYNKSWFALRNLENKNLVVVVRKPGRPLFIYLPEKNCPGTGNRPAPEEVRAKYPYRAMSEI